MLGPVVFFAVTANLSYQTIASDCEEGASIADSVPGRRLWKRAHILGMAWRFVAGGH